MPIYRRDGDKLFPVKEESFKLEADIQKLTEKNLKELFDLELVASEYKLKGAKKSSECLLVPEAPETRPSFPLSSRALKG